MFKNIFESRDRKVASLLKLGDCLGRSLRENVKLFSIDSNVDKVTYVTESDKVINGNFDLDKDIVLSNIEIAESEIYQDNEKFDSLVNDKISEFVGSIYEDNYSEANVNFSEVLNLWETRLKFDDVKVKLLETTEKFNESNKIINSDAFSRFNEILPQFKDFLKEHKEDIQNINEIKNAVKLSNVVSEAFNFPKLSFENLQEDSSYTVKDGVNNSVYEMICKQELVKKELLESKKSFDSVWATNEKVRNLASLIYDNDDTIVEGLVDALAEVPFLAFATKKQLTEMLSNSFSMSDSTSVTKKEIQKYSSKLFEYKKPAKQHLITTLNEKYGINVQNLKEPPSFKSLINTQVLIFEIFSKLSPKGSLQKEVLSEVASTLKTKNGVEGIDVNDMLQNLFEECEYTGYLEKTYISENLNLNEAASEMSNLDELVTLIKKTRGEEVVDELEEGEEKGEAGTEALKPCIQGLMKQGKNYGEALAICGKGNGEEKESVKEQETKAEKEEPPTEDKEKAEVKEAPQKGDSKQEFLDTLKELEEILSGMGSDAGEEESEEEEE